MLTESSEQDWTLPFVKHRRKTSRPEACSADIVDAKKITSSSGCAVTSSTRPGSLMGVSASRSSEPDSHTSRKATLRLSSPVANTRLLHRLRSSGDLLLLHDAAALPPHELLDCCPCLIVSGNMLRHCRHCPCASARSPEGRIPPCKPISLSAPLHSVLSVLRC